MSSIVWFEIPADDVERAKSFYGALFGWKIEKFQQPQQQGITNYIGVTSVDESAAKVEKLGGKICLSKTAVPQMGYFVICQDPENNTFALWEKNDGAK